VETFVSDIAIFVLKRDIKLQLTNVETSWFLCILLIIIIIIIIIITIII